jgi:hypothetical protein
MNPQPYYLDGWNLQFVFELALGLDPVSETLQRYNVTLAQYENYVQNPAFQAQLQKFRNDIFEKGLGYREKARAMSEDLMSKAYEMIHDKDVPSAVKADLIKWVGKMADLEPKQDKDPQAVWLPAIASAIQQLSEKDLEQRVAQIVARKQHATIDVTPDSKTIQ